MDSKLRTLEYLVSQLLTELGHDVEREGLKNTPKRFSKFLAEFSFPKDFEFTMFKAEGNQMIVQGDIPLVSLCEHHIQPIVGKAVVGYIPNERMAGLSKLARTVELFSRRMQNQERITKQVADFLMEKLNPVGVGVVIRANHSCMTLRGVRAHGSWTTTTVLLGAFKDDPTTRSEFLSEANRGSC